MKFRPMTTGQTLTWTYVDDLDGNGELREPEPYGMWIDEEHLEKLEGSDA